MDNNKKIYNLNNNTYPISGVKMLKSRISTNKMKSIVLFIDDLNNINYIIYDINTFQFKEYYNPLNNCLLNSFYSINIAQINDSNNYYLYCFYSSLEFSLVKLNENFKIISDVNDYKLNRYLINECTNYNFLNIIYESDIINALINCNEEDITFIKSEAEQEYIDMINLETNIPLDSIEKKFDKIFSYIQIGNSYEIKGEEGYNISISLINEQKEGNYIQFLSCEDKLRNYYNYTEETKLILFLIEIYMEEERWINNKLKYFVFNEKKEKLDLSICKTENIAIHYKIKNTSLLNLTRISYFDNLGINVFNRADPFFNDICFPYSEDGSDIIIKDRRKYIYQNYSICDESCEYEKVEIEKQTISCICSISSEFDPNSEEFEQNEFQCILLQNSTLGIAKCYKLVFNFKNKYKNIGFWVSILCIITHLPIIILYFKIGIFPIQKYIEIQMEKYHYSVNKNEKNINIMEKENHNINKNDNNDNKNDNIINNNDNKYDNKFDNNINNNNDNKNDNNNITKNYNKDGNNINKNDNINKNYNNKRKKIVKRKTVIKIKKKIKNNDINVRNIKKHQTVNIYKIKRNNDLNSFIELIKHKEEVDLNQLVSQKIINSNLVEYYNLIKMDANNTSQDKKPQESHYILNNYDYDLALKYEKRSFCRIFYIILLSQDETLNSIFFKNPLHLKYLRIALLRLSVVNKVALNAILYYNGKISEQFHYIGKKNFWYILYNNLFITVMCTLISKILVFILRNLTTSKCVIEKIFRNEEDKMRQDNKYTVNEERKLQIEAKIKMILKILKIKLSLFFIIQLFLLLFYFYFMIAFGEVYKYTQLHVLKDSITSYIISFPISISISLVLCILYEVALKYKLKILYKIILFFI